MHAAGERLDVQRLRVLPVDPVADAAQPREVAQALRLGGSAGHLRDRATSHRNRLVPVTSDPTPRPVCPVWPAYVLDLLPLAQRPLTICFDGGGRGRLSTHQRRSVGLH